MSTIDYEPATISAVDNAKSFAHTDIRRLAESLSPGDALTAAIRWQQLGSRIAEVAETLYKVVSSTVQAEWTGAAAESATRGVAAYSESVADLGDGFSGVFAPLQNLSMQAMQFSAAVPPVRDARATDSGDTSAGAEEEAAQTALHALINYGFVESDRIVPTLPRAFDPILDDLTGGATTTSTGTTNSGTQSSGSSHTNSARTDSAVPTDDSQTVQPPATDETQSTLTAQPATQQATTQPDLQQPSDSTDSATETPATRQASYLDDDQPQQRSWLEDPTRRSATPSPTTASPTMTPFGPLPVTTGQPVASNTNSVAPVADTMSRSTPAAVRTGMGGMGGMAPGAARKQDDETEHKTPSYLITEENGNALFPAIPKTAPPVLGA